MSDTPSIDDAKQALRKQMRAIRQSLKTSEKHHDLSEKVCHHFRHFWRDMGGKRVGSYSPVGSELDISPFNEALEEGVLCLPRVDAEKRGMTFIAVNAKEPLVAGYGQTLEPGDGDHVLPDIVIVPLLAFDASGYRLGQGGGFYDATLLALRTVKPDLLAIGAAFDGQMVDNIPREAHDVALDAIATPKGILYTNAN